MQNFIGIAGGDDLSPDRFIEKFRWRSILFFLFFFFYRMLLQIIIERTCLYLQLLPNELYNSYIRVLREEVYAIWFSLCFRTSRDRVS